MREDYFGNLAAELVDEQAHVAWVSEHLCYCSYDPSNAGLQWITRMDTPPEAKLVAMIEKIEYIDVWADRQIDREREMYIERFRGRIETMGQRRISCKKTTSGVGEIV
jgi:hypothetical protein